MAERDYGNPYYRSRRNQIPIIAEAEGQRRVPSLNEFWAPNPIHNRGRDESWRIPYPIVDPSYRSTREIDFSIDSEPMKPRENKIPFAYSRFRKEKDYPT